MTGHTSDEAAVQPTPALALCECGEDGEPCDECRDEFVSRLTVAELYGALCGDGEFGMLDYVVGVALMQARRAAASG